MALVQYMSLVNWFQGSGENNEKNSIYFTQEDELVDIITASKQVQIAFPSFVNSFNVDIGFKNRITNCNPAFSKMTPCVEKYYDEHFGTGYNDIVPRIINFTQKSYEGKFSLEAMTGCKEPCEITVYHAMSVASWHKDQIRDESIELFKDESDGLLIINHAPQDEVIKIDEVPRLVQANFFVSKNQLCNHTKKFSHFFARASNCCHHPNF